MAKKDIPKKEKISPVMNKLAEYYNYRDNTTLNNMRSSPTKEPFKILVACLLSLRARDENTEIVSKKLFNLASTPEKIIQMPLEKLKRTIYSSGHYNKKAQTLKHVSSELINRFDGKVPNKKEDLLSIKGIGPKTANIVLAFAFDELVLPIDTHCHRIPNRLRWVKTKNPEKTEEELEKILPKKYWPEFNSLFVQFGREICQPVSPFCSRCPIKEYCPQIGVKKTR